MNQQPHKQVTALRLIVAVMMLGMVMFGVVVSIIGRQIPPNPDLALILLAVIAFLAFTELPFYLVIRKVMLSKLRSQLGQTPTDADTVEKVLPVWQTLTLIRSAMLEGIGLFGLAILLVTGTKIALVAPAIALILLAAGFPSRDRLNSLTSEVTGQNPYAS